MTAQRGAVRTFCQRRAGNEGGVAAVGSSRLESFMSLGGRYRGLQAGGADSSASR